MSDPYRVILVEILDHIVSHPDEFGCGNAWQVYRHEEPHNDGGDGEDFDEDLPDDYYTDYPFVGFFTFAGCIDVMCFQRGATVESVARELIGAAEPGWGVDIETLEQGVAWCREHRVSGYCDEEGT